MKYNRMMNEIKENIAHAATDEEKEKFIAIKQEIIDIGEQAKED